MDHVLYVLVGDHLDPAAVEEMEPVVAPDKEVEMVLDQVADLDAVETVSDQKVESALD